MVELQVGDRVSITGAGLVGTVIEIVEDLLIASFKVRYTDEKGRTKEGRFFGYELAYQPQLPFEEPVFDNKPLHDWLEGKDEDRN